MTARVYEQSGKSVKVLTAGETPTIPAATTAVAGVVKKAVAVPDLAADADLPTTVAKVNALLVALRTAGIVS